MSTSAQLNANRANSLLSTGPRTAEGKATSSGNALKTALTGRTVLLPGEDPALYQHHIDCFFAEHKPATDAETELAQSLADTKMASRSHPRNRSRHLPSWPSSTHQTIRPTISRPRPHQHNLASNFQSLKSKTSSPNPTIQNAPISLKLPELILANLHKR